MSINKKIKGIFRPLWNILPDTEIRKKIHCKLYSDSKFRFKYRKEFYYLKFDNHLIKTKEIPFAIKEYYYKFFKFYTPSDNSLLIDAGAYDGLFSITAGLMVKNGSVLAFEPDPGNREKFNFNIALNEINNIFLVPLGLGVRRETVSFYSQSTVASSMYYKGADAKEINIDLVDLDSFLKERKVTKVDFIKMNIEGAEIEALAGASNTIRQYHPAIAVTTDHTINGEYTTLPVENFLKSFDIYEVFTLIKGTYRTTYAIPKTIKN